MVSCPYCTNKFGIHNYSKGEYYCPACSRYFISNSPTVDIENINIHYIPDAANADKGFYNIERKDSNFLELPEYDKLTINAESIIINNDKISIIIDKDNISKFNVIEINGVKFVKEDN